MAIVDLVMPKLGESIMEATILNGIKNRVILYNRIETVLDIATDKVDSEVPSTAAGTIAAILFKENDVVPIGSVIAKIETVVGDVVETDEANTPVPVADVKEEEEEIDEQGVPYVPVYHVQPTNGAGKMNRFYSPLVLNIANSEGISMTDLERIPGTGNEGRVTKKDILHYVQSRRQRGVIRESPDVHMENATVAVRTEPFEEIYAEELPKEYEWKC
jgi:2-oxoglutarate dehydrogenase E2 component (dihydrolipoamide succinyltransferase)